jgi:hypothetical protein
MRKLVVATATVAVFALLVSPALAGKGGNGNGKGGGGNTTAATAGITLNDPDPHLGEWVTFSVTLPPLPGWADPRIQIMCHQSGVLTYGEAGPFDQPFLLGGGSSEWLTNGGSADCLADLYYWSYNGGQEWNGMQSASFVAEG